MGPRGRMGRRRRRPARAKLALRNKVGLGREGGPAKEIQCILTLPLGAAHGEWKGAQFRCLPGELKSNSSVVRVSFCPSMMVISLSSHLPFTFLTGPMVNSLITLLRKS